MSTTEKIKALLTDLGKTEQGEMLSGFAVQKFQTRSYQILASGATAEAKEEMISAARALLLSDLTDLAIPFGSEPVVCASADPAAGELLAALVELLAAWDTCGLHGFVATNQTGVAALVGAVVQAKRVRDKFRTASQ